MNKKESLGQQIYIRADMNPVIATGHVMRCLAIAHAVADAGGSVSFILADNHAVELIQKHGFETIVLHTVWNDMDAEIPYMEKAIKQLGIKKLLIDSYQVTERYLSALTALTYTLYIDDMNSFLYPVNALLCYANYYRKFCYEERYHDRSVRFLIGMEYTPLRAAFVRLPRKQIAQQVENVLILSGGTDHYGIIERILESMSSRGYQHITAVCGTYYKGFDALLEKYKGNPAVTIYKNLPDLDIYMKEADLCISASGTTLYELCACGTPTISYILADNQIENASGFQEEGLIDCGGDVRTENVIANLDELLDRYADEKFRLLRSGQMQSRVDGLGADRIAAFLLEAVTINVDKSTADLYNISG